MSTTEIFEPHALANDRARIAAVREPLATLDVGHRSRFADDTVLPYFERLRREAPIHYCPDSEDGAKWVRYVNPLTSGPVMPSLVCYAARLPKNQQTRPKRSTYNAVCLVVAGEGRSTIGETTFDWTQHDVFSIPHWTWAQHEARGGEADLFVCTDRAVHEHLDTVREEVG